MNKSWGDFHFWLNYLFKADFTFNSIAWPKPEFESMPKISFNIVHLSPTHDTIGSQYIINCTSLTSQSRSAFLPEFSAKQPKNTTNSGPKPKFEFKYILELWFVHISNTLCSLTCTIRVQINFFIFFIYFYALANDFTL